MTLAGKTVLMSGGSRGIGLAIATRAARDGANVVLLAKTAEPHPKLEGTVYTAAKDIEAAGGQALPIVGDVRSEDDVFAAAEAAVKQFGGIDIVVNNASALNLSRTEELSMKRYDLMQNINTRGTFLLSKAAIPHLREAANPHILTLSPPLNLSPAWIGAHLGYTLSKYGMSLCTVGLAEELKTDGIAANSLWPRTLIDTAAVRNIIGGASQARTPSIIADAAYAILTRPSRECTGNLFIDDEVLAAEGVTDLSGYQRGDGELALDIFVDPA
ncbi:SDR family oxidoreductase [Amycolatopsis echigonensis]|uniref:Citronellol/citronellal dehydrogenase n=1 Tax=Amycolatopsis echigonensis TaxID=2576905 RepID=A0A2N3WR75_9PSEU|nr:MULTISPECIES: NAD(P)-dependent oxidoreductase [Amycolatopsis]MBB2502522.1 NAD(P)-dependent oxidoreductase [Amycolatopsis echigonensis]PKV96382.1 citronellol/citronellal dehydrogenase [Amycolatopsis niigatensis]